MKGNELVEQPKPSSKSAIITAKKISDKYKKNRNKPNIDVVEEIRKVASKKSTQIAAKKLSNKYRKMRYKKPPPMYLVNEEDIQTIDHNDDTSIVDVISKKGAAVTANKIKKKYKKMRAKRNNVPFDLNGVEKAETINYVDNTDIANLKLNKNAIIATKKLVTNTKN